MKRVSMADRLFRVTVRCRSCGSRIRFPVNKGRIRVVCPRCRTAFIFSLSPARAAAYLRDVLFRWFRRRPDAGVYTYTTAGARRSPYVKPVMTGLLLGVVLAAAVLSICDSRGRQRPPDGYNAKKTTASPEHGIGTVCAGVSDAVALLSVRSPERGEVLPTVPRRCSDKKNVDKITESPYSHV